MCKIRAWRISATQWEMCLRRVIATSSAFFTFYENMIFINWRWAGILSCASLLGGPKLPSMRLTRDISLVREFGTLLQFTGGDYTRWKLQSNYICAKINRTSHGSAFDSQQALDLRSVKTWFTFCLLSKFQIDSSLALTVAYELLGTKPKMHEANISRMKKKNGFSKVFIYLIVVLVLEPKPLLAHSIFPKYTSCTCIRLTAINWLFFFFLYFFQVIHPSIVFSCQPAAKRKRALRQMRPTEDQQQGLICSY